MIFLNCSISSFDKYKNLLERFSFFEHLYYEGIKINNFKALAKNYDLKAFGDVRRVKSYIAGKYLIYSFPIGSVIKYNKFIDDIDLNELNLSDRAKIKKIIKNESVLIRDFYQKKLLKNKIELIEGSVLNSSNFKQFCNNEILFSYIENKEIESFIELSKFKINEELNRLKKYVNK